MSEGSWWDVSWATGVRSSVYPKNNGKPGRALSWGTAGSALRSPWRKGGKAGQEGGNHLGKCGNSHAN